VSGKAGEAQSFDPPGANPTMILIGFDGNSCPIEDAGVKIATQLAYKQRMRSNRELFAIVVFLTIIYVLLNSN
jgi:hypothetical protein